MDVIGTDGQGTVKPLVVTGAIFLDGNADGAWTPAIASPDPGPVTLAAEAPSRERLLEH
jgi:hypothetical protein